MKKNKVMLFAAMLLLVSCKEELPSTVDMPYCDGNTLLPATELMRVERTDSTTVLTFMTMYDYSDFTMQLGNDFFIVSNCGDPKQFRSLEGVGSTEIVDNQVMLKKGVPAEYKMIFPAIEKEATSLDFLQAENGKVAGSISGIDLTGKRLPSEYPSDIPAALFEHDFVNDTLPRLVEFSGTAKVNVHVAGWRKWMSKSGNFTINTMADTQETIPFTLDDNGEATVEIPLEGTACISAHISTNTYATTYIDPNETIDMYLLPNNYSESQRWHRPAGVTNGKYRDIEAMANPIWDFQIYADTLLIGKTDRDEYFEAMMKIHSDGLDSLQQRNFEPNVAATVRAGLDRKLMYCAIAPYLSAEWEVYSKYGCSTPESVICFTPQQIDEIRRSIDFSNPLLELKSMANPGNRTRFVQAKKLLE